MYLQIASQGGGMLGFWINYACDRTISDATQTQWVVPLGIQLVPGVLLAIGMLFCPESPRWLARKDRWEEAEAVLVNLRGLSGDNEYIREELSEIRQQVEERTANKMTLTESFKRLIQKGVRNRILIGLLLMACQNMTGVNIITYCKSASQQFLWILKFDELTRLQTRPASSRLSASQVPRPSCLQLASTASPKPSA